MKDLGLPVWRSTSSRQSSRIVRRLINISEERVTKVRLKIVGIRKLPPGFERLKEIPFDFQGESLGDLIQILASSIGLQNRELFIERDRISPDLQAVVNGTLISDSNRDNLPLKEGDSVELISAPG